MDKVPDVTVAVERAVHDAFRDVAQAIFDQHGIQVGHVHFSWIDRTTCSDRAASLMVREVEIESRTFPVPPSRSSEVTS